MSGKTLPDDADLWLETVPSAYKWEWERAWQYGLAEDARESILAKLDVPANPNTPLAEVLDWEDEPRLRRVIEQMCDRDDIDYFIIVIRSPPQLKLSTRLLLYASLPLFLVLALLTRHPWWSVGSVVCYLILWLFRGNSALIGTETREYQIHPLVTFAQLAENIRETARNRGEEMREAAERFRRRGDGTIPA